MEDNSSLKYLSNDNIATIQQFINTEFAGPMPARKIYERLAPKLGPITEPSFCASLSANVKAGIITGIQGKRKVGYFKTGAVQEAPAQEYKAPIEAKETVQEIVEDIVPKPIEEKPAQKKYLNFQENNVEQYKFARFVWVGNRTYRVHKNPDFFKKTIENVLCGGEDSSGNISFSGKMWKCISPEIFEAIIINIFGGLYIGESAPVIDDGSGRTVEVRITSGETHIDPGMGLINN